MARPERAITHAEALLTLQEVPAAVTALTAAVPAAEGHLPQQRARITHALAGHQPNPTVGEVATAARTRLEAPSPLVVTSTVTGPLPRSHVLGSTLPE